MNRSAPVTAKFQKRAVNLYVQRPFVLLCIHRWGLNAQPHHIVQNRPAVDHLCEILPDPAFMLCGRDGKDWEFTVISFGKARNIVL